MIPEEMTREDFRKMIIAQDDDNDYSESGWVALVNGRQAALATYGHCSCYSTFTSLCGGGISDTYKSGKPRLTWRGTPAELVRMAARRADPAMPDRDADPKDYNYDHLVNVYDAVLEWDRKRTRRGGK